MAPVGMSFSLLIEDQGLIEVHFLSSWSHLIPIGLCCVLGLSFFPAKDREALYSQEKQDWELTVALIMNS